MSQPGWYPDPDGTPGRVRFWDGSAWAAEGVPMDPATYPAGRRPRPGVWLAAVIGVVLLGLVVWWAVSPRDGSTVAVDTQTARPTGSVWSEVAPTTPTPTPTDPSPTGATQVACPRVDNEVTSPEAPTGRIGGGGLSYALPVGWAPTSFAYSSVLTDQRGATRSAAKSTWASLMMVGVAPSAEGFDDPARTATQIMECHFTSARFSGYTGHEIEASDAHDVDGLPGHLVRANATSDIAPGGGATFLILVVDARHPEGLSAFWAGAVDADPDALADIEAALADLRVG